MSEHLTHHDPAVRLLIEQAEARGAERALREAADDLAPTDASAWVTPARFLRDRADRIAREEDR